MSAAATNKQTRALSSTQRYNDLVRQVNAGNIFPKAEFLHQQKRYAPGSMNAPTSVDQLLFMYRFGTDLPTVLAFLAYQILRTEDPKVIVQSLASAVATMFSDIKSTTHAPLKDAKITLTKYPAPTTSPSSPTASSTPAQPTSTLGFDADAKDKGKWEELETTPISTLVSNADESELAALFGVWSMAIGKPISRENLPAFNEKRAKAVSAYCMKDLVIFVNDSPFLTEQVLTKISKSFNIWSKFRISFLTAVVEQSYNLFEGSPGRFMQFFKFNYQNGLGALWVITQAIETFPTIVGDFPELVNEWLRIDDALETLGQYPSEIRPYVKYIYGSTYVPLPYDYVKTIFPMCRDLLKYVEPTMKNFGGPPVPAHYQARFKSLLAYFQLEESQVVHQTEVPPVEDLTVPAPPQGTSATQ